MRTGFPEQAPWNTSRRLLNLGESITFRFSLPEGVSSGDLEVFPRYLEQSDPEGYVAGGDLGWLDELQPERIPLRFRDGRAAVTYQPREPGSYLARWRLGDEVLYRYFAAIQEDAIVLRFSLHYVADPDPSLHSTGIPVDLWLPSEQFDPEDALCQRFLAYHRRFGETLTPRLPDTPDLDPTGRLALYNQELERVRALLPDDDIRSVRVEMHHDLDPGYTETLAQLGVNDHCGLNEANAHPWLGMPEFPYFSSAIDCRKPNQDPGGPVLAHQWDFCGGFHFLGPATWQQAASQGDWKKAEACLRQGMEEAKNLAEMSGHPAFLLPLYNVNHPAWDFAFSPPEYGLQEQPTFEFAERYQRFFAFQLTHEYKVAFARSIDIADYYRAHFAHTPRTIFVSKTDHITHDMWWLCHWHRYGSLITRHEIPWFTRISNLMEFKRHHTDFKDPLSCEYLLVEDQSRQMRFERECPNPIWWFDYRAQERGPQGSAITHTETPNVEIGHSPWRQGDAGLTIQLKMRTEAHFTDYAICLWGLPLDSLDRSRIRTDAKDFVLARNTEGEHHIVLLFDLRPELELSVTVVPGTGQLA